MGKMKRITLFLLALILVLSACGGGSEESSSEGSGSNEVIVGAWGGDYGQFLEDFVNPAITQEGLEVVYVPENAASRLTKVMAEKDGKGTFDVITMEDHVMQQLIEEDIMMELDWDKIPNAEHIDPDLRNPYFIPHIYSTGMLIYNENIVDEELDSWEAMWDPKYKGKVGILTENWSRYLYAAAAVEGVANSHEWDEAWDKLIAIKENEPKFFETQETLATALQTGEVGITISWKSRQIQWNNAGGDPIGGVVPKEGSFPTVFTAGIPKNATNIDEAYEYLNAMLDPNAQANFGESMGYAPTIDNADLTDEVRELIAFTEEEKERIKPIKLDYIAENYAKWRERYDREVAN